METAKKKKKRQPVNTMSVNEKFQWLIGAFESRHSLKTSIFPVGRDQWLLHNWSAEHIINEKS